MSQVKYRYLPALAGAAAMYLTLETEVQTMKKLQNHHWLFIGVICSQGHVNPSKTVAGKVAGLHIIFKSPSNMHQDSTHITSMSPFEEFHKGKKRLQYLLGQELKLFSVLYFNSKYTVYAVKSGISCFKYFRDKSHEAWSEEGSQRDPEKSVRERNRIESGLYIQCSPLIERDY